MTDTAVQRLVAQALAGRDGWERPQESRFLHAATGVQVLVYSRELVVVFGRDTAAPHSKAVSARTAYFPTTAVTAVVEVALALVAVRTAAAAGAAES